MARPYTAVALVALAAALYGCDTTTLDGLGNRTFAASAEDVRAATLVALDRLSVAVDKDTKTDTGRWIYAHTPDRSVSVQVTPVTPGSTQLSIVANGTTGPADRATATEILNQTALALEARLAAKPARTVKAVQPPAERK